MKTTYQKPAIKAIVMKSTLLNVISQDIVENGQDLGNAPTTDETSGNLSKRNSLWSDDVED